MLFQVRTVPKHRSTHRPNYQSTERESYERDETSLTIFPCVLGSALHLIRVCPGLSFATKRIGPPFCTLFTFVTCCSLQIILSQTIWYHLFQYLQRIPCWKPLIISFCSSLGSTLLLNRKDYDRSPILVGHHLISNIFFYGALAQRDITHTYNDQLTISVFFQCRWFFFNYMHHLPFLDGNITNHFLITVLKEICPRGNNNVIILFPYIMINVCYSC